MDREHSDKGVLHHLHGLDVAKIVLGKRDQLEALAEEAAELIQAALKCIRAYGISENPTPVTVDEARKHLIEEWQDVLACAYVLGLRIPEEEELQYGEKSERWGKRILDYYEKKMQEVRKREYAKIRKM